VLILLSLGDIFAFEDIRYEIACDFNPRDKTIKAGEKITFKNDTTLVLKEIYFRIYPNHKFSPKEIDNLYKYTACLKIDPFPSGFDAGEFQIQKITQRDKTLSYQIEGSDATVLKVSLDKPLLPAETIDINIDFFLRVPHRYGRYGYHNDVFALHRWYPILSVLDKQGGWHNEPDYIFQIPYFSQAADYKVKINLPQGYTAVSGLDIKEETLNAGPLKVISLESPRPLREFSFAISSAYKKLSLQEGTVTINSFYLQGNELSAQQAAEFARSTINYYSQRFGPYPYRQFSIAPVYLGYGGNQCSGMIFIDTRLYNLPKFLKRYFDYIVSHETGHQWWYNIVGNNKYKEIWLDEGINVYWLSKYIDDKYGPQAKVLEIPQWLRLLIPDLYFERTRFSRYYYITKRSMDSTIVKELPDFYAPGDIFAIAYGKGAGILYMLESLVGQDKVLVIMKAYFEKSAFKNASVKDFIDICNEVSGKDLNWFFDEWLYTAKSCDYKVEKVDNKKVIIAKNGNASMPVETKLEFKQGRQIIDYWDGRGDTRTIDIPKGSNLKSVYVDFENKILDFDRVNNQHPAKIDKILVPLYYGIYEVPVFLREDAYSWITGPAFSEYGLGLKSSFQRPDDYIIYAGSYYDSNTENLNTVLGFEQRHILKREINWGLEFLNRDSQGEEEGDLRSCKLYLRKNLLSVASSLFEEANNITLYLVHNQRFGGPGIFSTKDNTSNLHYSQSDESIMGWSYYLCNAGPLPDPKIGYSINLNQEFAGHFLGGEQYFQRQSIELDKYLEVLPQNKIALRIKTGIGLPKDKYLFYLGSDRQLRGYRYKDIKGSSVLLASAEYRFPLRPDIDWPLAGNTFNLNKIEAVGFFDIGKAWYNRFDETGFKKDVGLGLRLYFNVLVPIEEFVLRIDFARPLDGEDKDSHIWIGVGHAF
jgi:hypothetical protein